MILDIALMNNTHFHLQIARYITILSREGDEYSDGDGDKTIYIYIFFCINVTIGTHNPNNTLLKLSPLGLQILINGIFRLDPCPR